MDGSSNRSATSETAGGSPAAPVVIKKYANRRLYNTATSSYVTLDYLAQMVKDRIDFVVYDARSGDDITRSVLAQIIFDEENKGKANLLPIPFLRQLISFYGDSLQGMVPQYLEVSMQHFARNQEQMRGYMRNALGFDFVQRIEDMNRQNMAMFEQAMKMFNPFAALTGQPTTPSAQSPQTPPAAPAAPATGADPGQALEDLKRKLEELNKQVAEITRNRS
jgi:polyhydroxyalkanoate synthesis repressor PhaR